MSKHHDAIVIGGGHNGLTSAAYLARAGKKVLVLEKRYTVGGASATEEFAPGFRNSSCSFVVGYLRPQIIKDLQLDKYGLTIRHVENEFFALDDENYMLLTADPDHNAREISKFSVSDVDGLKRMNSMLQPLSEFFGKRMLWPPPTSKHAWRDTLEWLRMARDLLRMNRADRGRLVRVMTQSAGSLLDRYLESDEAKLPYAFGAISGNMNDLDTPTTAYRLLHGQLCEINGVQGAWGVPKGGMGAISDAICRAAMNHGAEVRTNAPVKRVLIENGRATGVELEDGATFHATAVLSNAEPEAHVPRHGRSGAPVGRVSKGHGFVSHGVGYVSNEFRDQGAAELYLHARHRGGTATRRDDLCIAVDQLYPRGISTTRAAATGPKSPILEGRYTEHSRRFTGAGR